MKNRKIRVPKELQPFILDNVSLNFSKEKLIGNGAQGTVYLASDSNGKKFAIKELNEDTERLNRQIKRYISECAALMRANHHPFIIQFVGMTNQYPLTIVTEFISFTSLSKFLTHKHYTVQSHNGTHMTKIALAIANGMMYLHKIGIIHRDLKPGNILIGNDFLPRICDFGLVREYNKKSHPTAALGTPNWMAPEVIRGGNYTEKCDVFSFAMILYEMVTGQRPLSNFSATEVLNYYADDNYRPPFPEKQKIPTMMKNLIERCWSEDPKRRPSFYQIFQEFADLKVKFVNSSDTKIKMFIEEIRKNDEKRKIIPPFPLFEEEHQENKMALKDKKNKNSKKKKNKNDISYSEDEDEDEIPKRNEKRQGKIEKMGKPEKKKKNNRKRKIDLSYSYEYSEDDRKRKANDKKPKRNKKEKKKKDFSESSDNESEFKLQTKTKKRNTEKPKRNKKGKESDDYESDNDIKNKKRKKEKSFKLNTYFKRNKHINNSFSEEESDSVNYLLKNSPKNPSKKTFQYSQRFTIRDDKKRDIFTVNSFNSSNDDFYQSQKNSYQNPSFYNSDNMKDKNSTSSGEAPPLRIENNRISTKKAAPTLKLSDSSIHSYSSYNDYDDDNDNNRNASKYFPLQSPAYNAKTPINYAALSDQNHPLFNTELEKVNKQHFPKFLHVLKSHLNSRTSPEKILLLLDKTNELLNDRQCVSYFCKSNIYCFLPYDIPQFTDSTIELLSKIFKVCPQSIERSFESSMLSIIDLRPKKAAELINSYAKSFAEIEDPWSMLDLLITHKKKFFKNDAGAIVVNTLLYLIQNYKNYKKSRLPNCRSVISFFISSPVKETAIAAYKATTLLFDSDFDLPFRKISNDLVDPDISEFVVKLFQKMATVTDTGGIPPVKEIIMPLFRIARNYDSATQVLLKMTKQLDAAEVMINSSKWLKYKLPTYDDTFKILISISRFSELKKMISETEQVAELFYKSVVEKEANVFLSFDKILSRVKFDFQFLEELQENDFFIHFFQGILEINDDNVTLSCLRALTKFAKICFIDEFRLFYKNLQRFSERDDEIAFEAKICIKTMTSRKRH
ncbi:hypothetical protein TRFO_10768 [Tritrichomonas foetus]|uniref:Protein kinase domain-containing protein n=1 Tax=Tritrichomonas foetus TaxID=1144522 RepID=A0A1J4J6K0_9EUKA|nr:hypothetical protein TRFO_10768 [Tritrichomonas foetus]|eukprot:OHS94854.1 hypothetical protein TRFO_10768 [Tritrichomonas foetus]